MVVGHKPDWFTGHHIPKEKARLKEVDIYEKVVEAGKVVPLFLFANDDHFILRTDPIDYYYSRPLFAKCSPDHYGQMCERTYKLFPDGMFYDIHVPMWIESNKIPTCYDWSQELVFKSVYCNHNKVGGVQMDDCKIPGFMPYESIDKYCENRSFMSLGANAFSVAMRKWLSDRFPNKSPFES
jgi:hypothetical protein